MWMTVISRMTDVLLETTAKLHTSRTETPKHSHSKASSILILSFRLLRVPNAHCKKNFPHKIYACISHFIRVTLLAHSLNITTVLCYQYVLLQREQSRYVVCAAQSSRMAVGLWSLRCTAFRINPPQEDGRCSLFPPTCLQRTENVKAPLNRGTPRCKSAYSSCDPPRWKGTEMLFVCHTDCGFSLAFR